MTRSDIVGKLKNTGFDLTVKSLSTYSAGKAAPNADTLYAISKAFNISIDWLLTGKLPEHPGLEKMREMIDSAVVEKGFALRDLDPDLAKVMQILIDLDPKERAPLAAMVEAYVNQRGRK